MMKQLAVLTLALGIGLIACNDSSQEVTPVTNDIELITSEDMSSIEYLSNEMEETIDALIETKDPSACVTFTLLNPVDEFPNTLIIDFGDGCEGPHGHVKSGKIIVTQSAPMGEEGAVREVNFKDFYIDSVQVTGTKSLTNIGVDTLGNSTLQRVSSIELIFPSGFTTLRNVNYTIEQIAGGATDERIDDIFQITGSADGINRRGHEYTATITEPLIRQRNCRWLVDGTIEFTVTTETDTYTRSIDYGYPNAECDNKALVTLNDGTEKVIRIKSRH